MTAPRAILDLEELGERSLPSALVLHPPDPTPASAVVRGAHPLNGTGDGTYHMPAVTIDAGTSFSLTGVADLGTLGSFHVSGGVRGDGMIEWGRATGDLVLSNAYGTIALSLHGATQPAFAAVPPEMVYSVTGGTGEYSHATGYGTVGMLRTPAPVAFGHPPVGVIALSFS